MTRHILFAGISTLALALAGCNNERDRTDEPDRDRVAMRDVDRARDEFIADAKLRLDQMNAKIDELSAKADVKSEQAAADLRARRDDLADRLDRAESTAGSDWDELKDDLDRTLTALETDLRERF